MNNQKIHEFVITNIQFHNFIHIENVVFQKQFFFHVRQKFKQHVNVLSLKIIVIQIHDRFFYIIASCKNFTF